MTEDIQNSAHSLKFATNLWQIHRMLSDTRFPNHQRPNIWFTYIFSYLCCNCIKAYANSDKHVHNQSGIRWCNHSCLRNTFPIPCRSSSALGPSCIYVSILSNSSDSQCEHQYFHFGSHFPWQVSKLYLTLCVSYSWTFWVIVRKNFSTDLERLK